MKSFKQYFESVVTEMAKKKKTEKPFIPRTGADLYSRKRGAHVTKKQKENDPKRQRKQKNWKNDY
jgi:hypothetical protein